MNERALVEMILKHPLGFDWSIQGFGMLRLYLRPDLRLHVWDSSFRVKNVSDVHNHPWGFTSTIICGEMLNQRFREDPIGTAYNMATIRCGENACVMEEPRLVGLQAGPIESYVAGQSYSQTPEQLHRSTPTPGTVTLCQRRFTPNTEFASVAWQGDRWIDAAPRKATDDEILAFCEAALKMPDASLTPGLR